MASRSYYSIALMICLVFLCIFVRVSSTQPLMAAVDDADQEQIENFLLNRYAGLSSRLTNNDHHYQRLSHFNPDDVQLTKRIIMLPRVGRRSIPSPFEE